MIINYKWVFVKNQSEKRRPAESGGDNRSDLIWTQTDRRHDLVLLSLAKNPFYDPADLLVLARKPLCDLPAFCYWQ